MQVVGSLQTQSGSSLGDGRQPATNATLSAHAQDRVLSRLLDGIYVYDLAEGRNVFVNRRYSELTGYSLEDLNAKAPAEFLELFHPDDRDAVLAHMERVAVATDDDLLEIEYRFKTATGSWMWCCSRDCVLDRAADGSVRRLIGYFSDVSRRKIAEREVEQDQQRKDRFLATLAHELRNPLAPLRSGIEILRHGGHVDSRDDRVLGMVERQLEQLIRLVDDLMEVSRITRSAVPLVKEHMDLREAIASAVESAVRSDLARREIDVHLPQEALVIEGDRVRIAQVMTNLLHNAAKYTDEQGHIWITAARERDRARVSVRDDGTGIEPDKLSEIFKVFYRKDNRAGGLGVGLTLARSLVELHGGTIEAHSEGPGRGSEFVVTLPLRESPLSPLAARAQHTDPGLSGQRVLVVDDNEDAAETLAMLLHMRGATVRSAHEARSGLALLEEFRPQVVLLDIGLPGMDGYEAARAIRADDPDHDILLVAVTGWGQETDKARALDAGFDHHMTKPVTGSDIEQLLAKIPPAGDDSRAGARLDV